MQLSIVVPVYNGGAQLERCLEALLASACQAYEIILVDDCSTDGSAAAWSARGVRVLRLASRRGPAAARNHGASRARGQVILFVDADVVVQRDTLARVIAFFREQPGVAALFGSYDDAPAASNFVSQYKNLLHHFVHQRSSVQAATFWAGCGAIRRGVFQSLGGFDERKYERPSIEDVELGYRLRRKGFAIVLDKELQVKHLKRWTLRSLLRTDIFDRALTWSQLILEGGGMINDLNLRVSERICAALAGLAFALFVLSYFSIALFIAALAALTIVFLLNLSFHRFCKERRGVWFAARAFVMLALYYLYSGIVFALAYCAHVLKSVFGVTRAAESGRVSDA